MPDLPSHKNRKIWEDPSIVFGLLAIVSLISFWPARHAGLVHDFVGWQEAYDHGSWTDIIYCFGYKGLHQVLHLVFYTLYRILGTHAIGWYVVFSLSHALLGLLVFIWLRKLQETYHFRFFAGAALAGALFILVHPHSTEVVIWKVCIHYILSGIWLVAIMIRYLSYTSNGRNKHLYWLWGLYALSLFTLEVSYVYPLIIFLMILISGAGKRDFSLFLKHLRMVFVPMVLILVAHLLLNRWYLGAWVGHYGADVHLNLDLPAMASNELKYLIKHLTLLRFSSHNLKVAVFDTLSSPLIGFHILTAILALAIFWVVRITRIRPKAQMAYLGVFGFFLLVLPVANLYFYHLMLAPNDRFGYVPVIMLVLPVLALVDAIPSRVKYAVLFLWLAVNLYFQQNLVHTWKKSNIVFESLTEDFRWFDREAVIMLNPPDNFSGMLIYSVINEPSGFVEVLEYNKGKAFDGIMYDVFMYNMMDLQDGVSVQQVGPNQIRVEFNQWGNWWFYNGIGALDYENEYYKVTNQGHHYLLEVREPAKNAAFIYQDGLSLKEFTFDPDWGTTHTE